MTAGENENVTRYLPGTTALVVPIPEAEPRVGALRAAFDPSAHYGVVAHVTVLYPFLAYSAIDEETLETLAELFGAQRSFEVSFSACGRFPGLLYLKPTPAEPFTALTQAVTGRWPALRPYGGRYGESPPHLSIGYGKDGEALDAMEAAVTPSLPFTSRAGSVHLVSFDGTRWGRRARFPLKSR